MNILPINNSIKNSVIYVLYREDVDYTKNDRNMYYLHRDIILTIGKPSFTNN